jgi:hypothetical protein
MSGRGRWRWIAGAGAITLVLGVSAVLGVPAAAGDEAADARSWAGRRTGACTAVPRPGTADPAGWRADTLRAAGCRAWLRLHHRAEAGRPTPAR